VQHCFGGYWRTCLSGQSWLSPYRFIPALENYRIAGRGATIRPEFDLPQLPSRHPRVRSRDCFWACRIFTALNYFSLKEDHRDHPGDSQGLPGQGATIRLHGAAGFG
jgi:hypothetical protein